MTYSEREDGPSKRENNGKKPSVTRTRTVDIAQAQSLLYVSYMDSVVIPSLLVGSDLAIAVSVSTRCEIRLLLTGALA